MKIDALDHPKTIELAAQLGVCLPQAIGHLELLWAFVAQKTPRGNVGRWSDAVIAHAAQWTDKPEVFVKALICSGFFDACEDSRIVIHDWSDHCPNWVRSKLKREKKEFLSPVLSKDSHAELSKDLSADLTSDYKPSQAKPSLTKADKEHVSDSGESDATVKKKTKRAKRTADRFVDFWQVYPKRVGRKNVLVKWKARNLDSIADQIIADVKSRKANDSRWLEGFIPNPETYINGDRWEDEIQAPRIAVSGAENDRLDRQFEKQMQAARQ